jgi:hypothetical protein
VTTRIDPVVHVRVATIRGVVAGIPMALPPEVGVPHEDREQEVARAEEGEAEIGEGQQSGFLPGFALEKRSESG